MPGPNPSENWTGNQGYGGSAPSGSTASDYQAWNPSGQAYGNGGGAGQPRFTISPPQVGLNPSTTYESPFFWLILGAGATVIVFYMIKKGHL